MTRRPPSLHLRPTPAIGWLTLATLIGGVLLRFAYLGADPHYDAWIGYITDEGRWVENARSLWLHGRLLEYEGNLHLLLAPLFSLASYLAFVVCGLSGWSARLFPALCGSALLVLVWLALRHVADRRALLLGLVLLAVQPDLVALGRLAVPEIPVLLALFLAYLAVVRARGPLGQLVGGGLLLLAVGLKATVAPVVLAFAGAVVAVTYRRGEAGAALRAGRGVAWQWTGLGVPLLALCGTVWIWHDPGAELLGWPMIRGFIGVGGLYRFFSFPFDAVLAPTCNTWLLGLWCAALAWLALPAELLDDRSRRHLLGAASWLVLHFALVQLVAYSPERYKVALLLPLAVLLVLGLSLLGRIGLAELESRLSRPGGWRRIARLAALAAPSAVVAAPLVAAGCALAGASPERLLVRMFSVLLALIGLTALVTRRTFARILLLLPAAAVSAWWLGSTWTHLRFWPEPDAPWTPGAWGGLVLLSALAAALGASRARIRPQTAAAWVAAPVLAYAIAALVAIAPQYLEPRYTIRDASRELGGRLDGASVAVQAAEGLFNDNAVPYRSLYRIAWQQDQPQYLVSAFEADARIRYPELYRQLDLHYRPIAGFELHVSPEYLRRTAQTEETTAGITTVRLYRRAVDE